MCLPQGNWAAPSLPVISHVATPTGQAGHSGCPRAGRKQNLSCHPSQPLPTPVRLRLGSLRAAGRVGREWDPIRAAAPPPWTAAHQAPLSFTISRSLLKLMSTEWVMPSQHLILSPPSPPALNLSQHLRCESRKTHTHTHKLPQLHFFFLKNYLFIYSLPWVLVMACRLWFTDQGWNPGPCVGSGEP